MSPPTPVGPVHGRLRRRLITAAFLALTPVLALAGMLVIYHVAGSHLAVTVRDTAEARHLAIALSSSLHGLIERQALLLDTVSTSFRKPGSQMYMMNRVVSDMQSHCIIGCSVFSTDGQLLCTAGTDSDYTPLFDASPLEPVLSGNEPSACFISAHKEDGADAVPRVILAGLVQDRESEPRVLAMEIDMDWMARAANNVWGDDSGPDVCGVVDPTGQMLLWDRSGSSRLIRKSPEPLGAMWTPSSDEAATIVFTHTDIWDSESVSATYEVSAVAIPSLKWASIAATKADPVGDVTRDQRLKHMLSMVITALAGLLAAVGIMRRVAAEACALERAAIAVAAGDLSARCGLRDATDVGAAGQAFDEMAVSLAELEQSRLQALRVASHELRNPLCAVKGAASLLKMRLDERKQPAEVRPLVDIVVRQADYLADKVTQIFDALILTNHWRAMEKKPVELRELTREVLRPFLAGESGNRLAICGLDLHLPDLVVIGDREQLKTVIVSLVANALKYSMGQGMVCVTVRPTESGARISVCDRGIGVPDVELSSIFDGFARGSNLEGRDPGGLGLGLYVSAVILRQHGGTIWAESDGHTGARFHVDLPLHPVASSACS